MAERITEDDRLRFLLLQSRAQEAALSVEAARLRLVVKYKLGERDTVSMEDGDGAGVIVRHTPLVSVPLANQSQDSTAPGGTKVE